MVIQEISKQRGIKFIYDGSKYIIFSDVYGVVAESSEIIRSDDLNKVDIKFDICEWFGYWSLTDIITRGVKKFERTKVRAEDIKIKYNKVAGQQMHLNRRLNIFTEEY